MVVALLGFPNEARWHIGGGECLWRGPQAGGCTCANCNGLQGWKVYAQAGTNTSKL